MGTLLRLALLAAAAGLLLLVVYSPQQWRRLGRRVRIVGWAYVAAILIGAALRIMGVYG